MKSLGSFLLFTVRTLVVAALFAAGILMLRPPIEVRPSANLDPALGPTIAERLMSASVDSRTVKFTWGEVNALVASRMQSARIEGSTIIPVKFVRCYAAPGDNAAVYVLERTVFDYPIYTGIRISGTSDGQAGKPLLSGFIGRLPLPVSWAMTLNPVLAQSAEFFAREQEILADATTIDFRSDSLEVRFEKR